jgi:hypothetical protein
MNPADIVEKVKRCGVSLALNDAGTGVSLWAESQPPREIIDLVRDARDALVACLARASDPETDQRQLHAGSAGRLHALQRGDQRAGRRGRLWSRLRRAP